MANKKVLNFLDDVNNFLVSLSPEDRNNLFISSSKSYRHKLEKVISSKREEISLCVLISIDENTPPEEYTGKLVYIPWRLNNPLSNKDIFK